MIARMEVDVSALEDYVKNVLGQVTKSVQEAVLVCCEELLIESQAQCPIDTGDLVQSGFVEVKTNPHDITGTIGYARDAKTAAYGSIVHEDLSVHHVIGKAKFLEDPVRDYTTRFGNRASLTIQKGFTP